MASSFGRSFELVFKLLFLSVYVKKKIIRTKCLFLTLEIGNANELNRIFLVFYLSVWASVKSNFILTKVSFGQFNGH